MIRSGSINLRKIDCLDLLSILMLFVFAAIFIFPFYICIVTSIKTPLETATSVLALPSEIQWSNFSQAIKISKFSTAFINSSITTFCSVFLIVVCSSMAGYVISRNYKQKFFTLIEMLYLGAMMLPFQIIMIPVYRMMKNMNMINSLWGLILLLVGTSMPYSTFLYIGFVKTVPKELEEAAIVDGYGPYRLYWQIVFPLLKPITSTVAALHVLWMWNEFTISLIMLQKDSVRTIPIQQYFFFGQYTVNLNLGFASAVLSMIPVIIFFLASQKYIIEGVSAGAVKG